MLWPWGARPPYCSGSSPRAAPGRGLRAAPARWRGLARRRQPPREQAGAGGGGRWGAGRAGPAAGTPPASRFLTKEDGRPLGCAGAGVGRCCGPQAGGGAGGGGRGGRSAAPRPPAPSGVGLPSFVFGLPHLGILVLWGLSGGRGRQVPPGRPPVGQCGGGGTEGGSDILALVCAPAFPRPASECAALFALSWAPPFRGRLVAGNAGACGRFTGGAWRAAALAAAVVSPPLGAAASPWGCGAAVSPVGLRPLLGPGGGERGGGTLVR